jgi:putative hemolysin
VDITINPHQSLQIRLKMKKITIAATILLLTACVPHNDRQHAVGMANPASVHCEKMGGKLDIVKGTDGDSGYCNLPGGERIEEWALYRRDNQ